MTAKRLLLLMDQQEYRCALTGRELTADNAALDHLQACANDGRHIMSNVRWVHEQANKAKGTMSDEEFYQLCLDVVNHHAAQTQRG